MDPRRLDDGRDVSRTRAGEEVGRICFEPKAVCRRAGGRQQGLDVAVDLGVHVDLFRTARDGEAIHVRGRCRRRRCEEAAVLLLQLSHAPLQLLDARGLALQRGDPLQQCVAVVSIAHALRSTWVEEQRAARSAWSPCPCGPGSNNANRFMVAP